MVNAEINNARAVYLTAEDLRVASSIIYNSYYDDPFFTEALGAENKLTYSKKLRSAIREELNSLWQQEQALIGLFDESRMVGVACVMTQELPVGEDRYWNWRLKMVLGTGWKSTQSIMEKESCIQDHLPNNNCGVIQFIAISPIEQSKGYGIILANAALSWGEENPSIKGIGVFVNQQDHYDLFLKVGFKPLTEVQISNIKGHLLFVNC
ncbi:GNAT family N-acetyltransferase [Parashewanella spongiae]|uniref:GNAT family N-acetyltransferase n=1 Tax=Parashewanella spongiae TaxID=342950 RepID=A0A3A6UJW6_9GAMM|nr:GNAT family N-acetyltransferase [Parashewanella spongiae]MCL1076749.1 GNAT family N-acetyltransferase [Parashewanella spongiae]RJY19491.1 GNAT family N-acetyltransferase [Parashewanella spongiae]